MNGALKRDMAFKRIVSFEAPVGGAMKRLQDLMFALLSAPFWALAVATVFFRRKSMGRRRVISGEICIGYGGKPFRRWSFTDADAKPERCEVVPINDSVQAALPPQEPQPLNFFSALPGMINVLLGQMSLIGPTPLTRTDFDAQRGRRKNYASARPGLIDAFEGTGAAETRRSPYGNFSIHWSTSIDLAIARRAIARLLARMKDQAREKTHSRQ